MANKINKYSWIHELNRAALDAKCKSDIKIQNLNEMKFTARQDTFGNQLDPETLANPEYQKAAARRRPHGRRPKTGTENRDTGVPQSGGERISFPTELKDASSFASNLVQRHQEADKSRNMGSVDRHGELIMQFLSHAREHEHLNPLADKVKNYIGRYQLNRAKGERSAATPEKVSRIAGQLPQGPRRNIMNQLSGSINRMNTGSNPY